jgi:hypothetical protein
MRDETWKPIVGLEGYFEVSDLGRIRSLPKLDAIGRRVPTKVLNGARLTGRYYYIRMRCNGRTAHRAVHHLVLEAFVGPRPKGMHGCHEDRCVANNALSNLRWDTPKGNAADKVRHGTVAKGERNGWAKLTADAVVEIRALLRAGCSKKFLARTYGISDTHVASIATRKVWNHVA